jgi:hypothetical protein
MRFLHVERGLGEGRCLEGEVAQTIGCMKVVVEQAQLYCQ